MRSVNKVVVGLAVAAAIALPAGLAMTTAPIASAAYTNTDALYLNQLHNYGIYNPVLGDTELVATGHEIAADISNGVAPAVETTRVYNVTVPTFTWADAGYEVKAATYAYAPQMALAYHSAGLEVTFPTGGYIEW